MCPSLFLLSEESVSRPRAALTATPDVRKNGCSHDTDEHGTEARERPRRGASIELVIADRVWRPSARSSPTGAGGDGDLVASTS
jgi:hypothetical protein